MRLQTYPKTKNGEQMAKEDCGGNARWFELVNSIRSASSFAPSLRTPFLALAEYLENQS